MNKKVMCVAISLLIMSFEIFGCTPEPTEREKAFARSLRAEAPVIDFAMAARAAQKVQEDTDCLRAVERSYNQLGVFILRMPLVRGPQTTTDINIPRSKLLGFSGPQPEIEPETIKELIAHSDESAESDLRPRKITFVDPALLPISVPVIPKELLEDACQSYELIKNIAQKRNLFISVARDYPQDPMEQFRLVAYAAAKRAAIENNFKALQKIVAIDPENIRFVHKKFHNSSVSGIFIRVVDTNGACAEILLKEYVLKGGHINPRNYTKPGILYQRNPLANQASAARRGAAGAAGGAGSSADQAEDSDKRCTLQ